ncbi:MAG: hypothetical protein ACK55Z_23385 [bacterium]
MKLPPTQWRTACTHMLYEVYVDQQNKLTKLSPGEKTHPGLTLSLAV